MRLFAGVRTFEDLKAFHYKKKRREKSLMLCDAFKILRNKTKFMQRAERIGM